MPLYQLDFDQVAEVGLRTRGRPTFALAQLDHALNPAAAAGVLVQQYRRFHHGAWYLPLVEAHVRTWLKRQLFTAPPAIVAGGVDVTCSRPVEADPAELALWRLHYNSGYFAPTALEAQYAELAQGQRYFSFGQESERVPRLLALRELLGKEVVADG